jgi:hypothetical protein
MKLIAELYRPQLAMLPIGDLFTMGPREAPSRHPLPQREARYPYALRHIPGSDRHDRKVAGRGARHRRLAITL